MKWSRQHWRNHRRATVGVLFKNAEAIETLRKVKIRVVDKTGTLTEGKPKLIEVVAAPGIDKNRLLLLAASLEKGSEHPLAAAIVEGAINQGLHLADAKNFTSHTGKGVSGEVDGQAVLLGNTKILEEFKVDAGSLAEQALSPRSEGETVMYVAVAGKIGGLLAVADPIKKTTPEAIRQLHAEGIRIVMLTGDNKATAKAVALKLDLDEVVAEVLPDEKAAVVKQFQHQGHIVAMAGMVSMMHRPWPRLKWGSPWAPALMLLWRVPALLWLKAISPESSAPDG